MYRVKQERITCYQVSVKSDQFIGSIDGTHGFTWFGAKLDCWMNIQNQDCHAKKKYNRKKQRGACNEDPKEETTSGNNSKNSDRMIEDDDSCEMFWCNSKHWCKPQKKEQKNGRNINSTIYWSSAASLAIYAMTVMRFMIPVWLSLCLSGLLGDTPKGEQDVDFVGICRVFSGASPW